MRVEAEAATAAHALSSQSAPTVTLTQSVDPVSLLQAGVDTEDLKLALGLKELDLQTRSPEVELMHLKIRALELEKASVQSTPTPVRTHSSTASAEQFDISRHIALVPPFRDSEVDSYLNAFEHSAATLGWPKDVWRLLLRCKLVGKAQEVCTSLSIEESLDYDVVKATVIFAYELVPEAYHQNFRSCEKSANQTYVEFARDKTVFSTNGAQQAKRYIFHNCGS